MKKTVRRALAATTAGAAGLAGALAFQVPTTQAAPADAPRSTNYAMSAWGSGSKFVVDNTEIRNLRSGFSIMQCTRLVGQEAVGRTLDFLPVPVEVPQEVRDLIDVELIKTTNNSYEDGSVLGARARTTIGSIVIGAEPVEGLPLSPQIVIEGLTSEATSFVDRSTGVYGTGNAIRLGNMLIKINRETIPAEIREQVEPLLDVIDQVQAEAAPVSAIVTTIVDLVGEFGEIPLPGLGSISLVQKSGQVTAHSARSQSRALVINVDPDGPDGTDFENTRIELGRALSSIGGDAYAGVFRSRVSAFQGSVLGGLLDLRSPGRPLPCEGTRGKVVTTEKFNTGTIVGTLGVGLTGVQHSLQGQQFRTGRIVKGRKTNQPWMSGFIQTAADEISIPLAGVRLVDVVSRVGLSTRRTSGANVASRPSATVGQIWINGEQVAAPKPGEPIEFDLPENAGKGVLKAAFTQQFRSGAAVQPLQLFLFLGGDEPVTIDLAQAVATIRETR